MVMESKLLVFFMIIICCLSCKKGGDSNVITDPVIPLPIAVTNINNDLLLRLINEKRTAGCNCGLTVMPPVAALSWNNALAVATSRHSTDMNTYAFFSHTSSNGATLNDRINATGYKWTSLGENLAKGQTSEQAVVDDWMASEEHCKNIMNANFKETGAAKAGVYWTQDFAKPQ